MKTPETFKEMLEKQQAILDSWTNTSKSFAEDNYNAISAPLKKTSEMLLESMKAQQAFLDGVSLSKDPAENVKKTASYFQNWLAMQGEFTEKWLDLYKDFSGNQLIGLQKEQGAKFSSAFKKAYEDWAELMKESYTKLNSDIKEDFDGSLKNLPTLSNFIKAYDDLNNYWKGLLENGIIKGYFTKEEFQKYFPDDAFVRVIDSLVGLQSVESLKKNIEAYDEFFNSYISKLQETQTQTEEVAKNLFEQMEATYKGTAYESLYKMYSDLKNQLVDGSSLVNKADVQEQTKKLTESYLENRKLYLDYAQKVSNFQQKIYAKSKTGLAETLESFWTVYQMKGKTPNYDEFVAQWLKQTQSYISDILNSAELSNLKTELETSTTHIAGAVDKMMQEYVKLFAKKEATATKVVAEKEVVEKKKQ